MYLVGYVLGPLFFGPLSETYGRKYIMTVTFCLYTLFTLACAVAPNWPALLVFRLIVGMSAACPVTVVGGLYADVFADPVTRGRAMALFMAVCARHCFLSTICLTALGDNIRSLPRARCIWLHLGGELEMDLLGWAHCSRIVPDTSAISPRNLCAGHSQTACPAITQDHWR